MIEKPGRFSLKNFLREYVDYIFLVAACLMITTLLRGQVTVNYKKWQKQQWQGKKILHQQTRASQIGLITALSTGFKPLIADIYWTKAMALNADQVFEMQKDLAVKSKGGSLLVQAGVSRTTADSRELYDIIRMVTNLDPSFEYAYYYGSTLLSWDDQVPLALSLLEAGFRENPDSGMLASSLAFIHYYFLQDWETGAEYARMSFENSGKLASSPKEVANLYAAGRNYDLAIAFIQNALETTQDEGTREELENQLRLIIVEKHIDILETALRVFKAKTGFFPNSLERLVSSQVLRKLPEEPFGGKYVISGPGRVENEPRIRNDHYSEMRKYRDSLPAGGRKRL